MGLDIELIEGEIHRNYLREAYAHAWHHSEDCVTKTGAVIVNSGLDKIISYGANHFPEGLCPGKELIENRKWKYDYIIHAEPAAIYAAAKRGKPTDGAVMYVPWVPCIPCARAIIDSGISKLIGHKPMIDKTPERWLNDTRKAFELLEKCNVEHYMFDGSIGEVKNLFNGEIWYP